MKINSFIQDKNKNTKVLSAVEVELSLWPGLPGIHFIGLPDQHLKESAFRIKSALKSQGFKFPTHQQILVNLRPSHLKKNSRGLELAVAAAYLMETEQIPRLEGKEELFVYGELGLNGDVYAPSDLNFEIRAKNFTCLTGKMPQENLEKSVADENVLAAKSVHYEFDCLQIQKLSDLGEPQHVPARPQAWELKRPSGMEEFRFTSEQADLLKLAALGGHSCLLAGPAGSGKSTMAKTLHSLMSTPHGDWRAVWKSIHGEDLSWRPFANPHSNTPVTSLIGGGTPPKAGEFSRAHGGLLVLDELLEFPQPVIEATRGIIEEKKVRLPRLGYLVEYPAVCQVVATTNLCPCGDWTPEIGTARKCSYTLQKCRSYGQRLSGPLLDRFEVLFFTKKKRIPPFLSWTETFTQIEEARKFQFQEGRGGILNTHLRLERMAKDIERMDSRKWIPESYGSERRRNAIIRVARSLADLALSQRIEREHLVAALAYCFEPYIQMQKC